MEELNKETLAYYYIEKDLSQREIAEKFDLSQACISKKMKKFGINSDYSGFWSDEEERKLRQNYRQKSKKEVMSLLPDRSWEAIKLKAIELDLSKPISEHRHSEQVLEILRENAEEDKVEIDYDKVGHVSYVFGVIDGDGFHDNEGTIGLEVNLKEFAEKFKQNLQKIGFNPGRGQRRGKETVWASSTDFVEFLSEFNWETKFKWLNEQGDAWKYIEGAYDSDGDLSNSGPRICSYNPEEKKFIHRILTEILGLEASIHQNNVYVKVSSRDEFFENVDPVYERRRPAGSGN